MSPLTAVLRPPRWLLVATLLTITLSLYAQVPQDFSVVLLPDTQYYSETYPQIYQNQTQWIVDNRTAWNIQFVIGEGDIVNKPGNAYEWVNADTAVKTLDNNGMPYAMAIGNHDYDGVAPSKRGTTAYNQTFGVARYSGYPWYGGSFNGTNENFYTFFTVNGQRYMVLALEYFPRNEALTWADNVLSQNPDAIVIVTTHSFEFWDGSRGDKCDSKDMSSVSDANNPEATWEKLLSKYPNVQLIVSGHLVTANSAHRTDIGPQGNLVNQIFTNFQNWSHGGNGYLRILKFRPSLNVIEVYTYSPYLNQSLTDATYQFTLPMTNAGNTAMVGGVEGKVRTPSCSVIAGATVTAATVSTTTDVNGRYLLTGLAPGTQTVSVTAPGYSSLSATSTISAGYDTQTNFYPSSTTTGAASCTLSTVDPSVTICVPSPNTTVSSPVHINAGATASAGISYMQVYVDGVKQNTFYASSFDTNDTLTSGTHKLTVQARLANGTTVKNSISISVGSSGGGGGGGATPGITMTSPVDGGTYSNPVQVSATATSTVAISYTQLYVDGVKKYQVSGGTMSTSVTISTGTHRITAQAKDANGTYYKQTAYITVN